MSELTYKKLIKNINTLNPTNLLDFLVSHYEAIVSQRVERELTITTQKACFEEIEEINELLSKQLSQFNDAARACRFIIEYVVAKPPKGLRPISYGVFDDLMALASEIIARGSHSDMLNYEIYEVKLEILASGRLGYNYSEINKAQSLFIQSFTRERIRHANLSFSKWWKEPEPRKNKDLPSHVEEANEAFEAEFGVGLSDISDIVSELANLCISLNEGNQFSLYEKTDLITKIIKVLNWEENKIIQCLDFLTLKIRENFLNPPSPFTIPDVYPWRLSRGLSYIRRPLVEVEIEGKISLGWGFRNLFDSFNYILENALNGRLAPNPKSSKMRKWLGKFRFEEGKDFNDLVFDNLSIISEIMVKKNLIKIGSERIREEGNDLGDIDVLCVFPKKKTILVIECKNLSIARTPVEMKRELDQLFIGTQKKDSTVVKHQRRVDWIKKNITKVLTHYGFNKKGIWKVEPLIIVNNDLITSYFHKSPIPVFSLLRFTEDFLPKLI